MSVFGISIGSLEKNVVKWGLIAAGAFVGYSLLSNWAKGLGLGGGSGGSGGGSGGGGTLPTGGDIISIVLDNAGSTVHDTLKDVGEGAGEGAGKFAAQTGVGVVEGFFGFLNEFVTEGAGTMRKMTFGSDYEGAEDRNIIEQIQDAASYAPGMALWTAEQVGYWGSGIGMFNLGKDVGESLATGIFSHLGFDLPITQTDDTSPPPHSTISSFGDLFNINRSTGFLGDWFDSSSGSTPQPPPSNIIIPDMWSPLSTVSESREFFGITKQDGEEIGEMKIHMPQPTTQDLISGSGGTYTADQESKAIMRKSQPSGSSWVSRTFG